MKGRLTAEPVEMKSRDRSHRHWWTRSLVFYLWGFL